jgi:hypothetical protein
MKNYILFLLYAIFIASCTHKEEVHFKLPDVPYATAGEAVSDKKEPAVNKKEFSFPVVPYAQ